VMSSTIIYAISNEFLNEKSMIHALSKIKEQLKETLPVNHLKAIVQATIELMQNIINYSNIHSNLKERRREGYGSFSLIKKEIGQYKIITSNPINHTQKRILQERVGELSNLDKRELQSLLKESIRSKRNCHKKGAGVGLIRVFINSISAIKVDFKLMNNREYIFTMEISF